MTTRRRFGGAAEFPLTTIQSPLYGVARADGVTAVGARSGYALCTGGGCHLPLSTSRFGA
jgi:hypothetical protein